MSQVREKILQQIKEIPRLATLPAVAIELIQLLEEENVRLQRVKELLETDPSLTIKVLKIANSPVYGTRWRINTIDQALSLIGLNELNNILISVSMYSKLFHREYSNEDEMKKLWQHSIACAFVSRSLARKFYLSTLGREYVAGLLHDIGKIVLIEYFKKEVDVIRSIIKEENISDRVAEERVLGISHDMIGAQLGKLWNLPESLINVMMYHHTPRQDKTTTMLCAVVHIADVLCQQWEVSTIEGGTEVALINDEGWQILLEEHPHLADVNPDQVSDDLKFDLYSAQLFSSETSTIQDDNSNVE